MVLRREKAGFYEVHIQAGSCSVLKGVMERAPFQREERPMGGVVSILSILQEREEVAT